MAVKQSVEVNRLLNRRPIGWINDRPHFDALTSTQYDALLAFLVHPKARIRRMAASGLGNLGDRRAVTPLVEALHDAHGHVRLHAAQALGRLGDPVAVEPLLDILNDECTYVRRRVVTALGQLGASKSQRVLECLLSALKDQDAKIRARAVVALKAVPHPQVVDALVAAVCDPDSNVSWRAIDALVSLRALGALSKTEISAVVGLIDLLSTSDPKVRYRAVKALGNMRDWRAIKSLQSMKNDPDQRVRDRVRFALCQFENRANWERCLPWRRRLDLWWKNLRGFRS